MKSSFLGLIVSLILNGACLSAEEPEPDPVKQQAFNTVFADFERLLHEKNIEQALQKSREAFNLGKEIFGDTHKNTAALAYYHGRMLSQVGQYAQALDILTEAIAIYGRAFGTDALELIPVLEAYGMNMALKGTSNSKEQQAQSEYLHRALDIQRRLKPEDRVAYAELAARTAPYLYKIQPVKSEAVDLLRESLAIQESVYGKDALELVPVLMALGDVSAKPFNPSVQKYYYNRALNITKKLSPEQNIKYAELSLKAGQNILKLSASRDAKSYLDKAYNIYKEEHGVDHMNTALAALALGNYYFAAKDYGKVEEYLLPAQKLFARDPNYRNVELLAHGVLAETYERWNKSDLVTEHLMAIGRITPWTPDQEVKPVVRINPVYPQDALGKGGEGWVKIDFTVDETGRVQDAMVTESDGLPSLKNAALEAVHKWRYAPRFVDGKPVATPHICTEFRFEIEN